MNERLARSLILGPELLIAFLAVSALRLVESSSPGTRSGISPMGSPASSPLSVWCGAERPLARGSWSQPAGRGAADPDRRRGCCAGAGADRRDLHAVELAVHPDEGPTFEGGVRHQLTFMCDDIRATVQELRSKGVEVRGAPEDGGWGISTTLILPGAVEVMLYEPRHPTAIT